MLADVPSVVPQTRESTLLFVEPTATTTLRSDDLARLRDAVDQPWIVQAALSGYSDLAMRRVARFHGARLTMNEVVIDELLVLRGKARRRLLDVPDDDHPVGGQLMGARPETFGRAARDLVDAGYDTVDINFGCPVPRVLDRCRGGFLLGHPGRALEIVDRVLQSVGGERPVTVKLRRGVDDSRESSDRFFAILDGAFELGVSGVTVHGRTVRQRYVGPSDWDFLRRVKRHVGTKTVFGSGDLFQAADVVRMLACTGVDGVTLARGCIGNPFLFGQVRDLLAGRPARAPTIAEQRRALALHWTEAASLYGPGRGLGRWRRHALQYAALHPDPVAVRDAFVSVRSEARLVTVLDEWYAKGTASGSMGPVQEEVE